MLSVVYGLFVALRIAWVFSPQTGYVHPDEFFQFSERVAADVFGIDVQQVWEFDSSRPVRSVFFPFLICGLPFAILRELLPAASISGYWLLVAPRAVMAVLSLVIDISLHGACSAWGVDGLPALVVFASSYVALVFCTRTLTNSIEAALFAVLLSVVITDTRKVIIVRNIGRCDTSKRTPVVHDYKPLRSSAMLSSDESGSDTKASESQTGPSVKDDEGRMTSDDLDATHANATSLKAGLSFQVQTNEATSRINPDERRFARGRRPLRHHFIVVTVVVAGFFNRPTFLAFAAVPFVFWLFRGRVPASFNDFARAAATGLCCLPFACNLAVMLVLWDSYYYRAFDASRLWSSTLVITPLNFLSYNADAANLAKHGLHPRYLHVAVNVPLLLGPMTPFVIAALLLCRRLSRERLLVASFVTPLAVLSLFPHQEARFLVPLVVPAVLVTTSILQTMRSNLLCSTFGVLWLTFNVTFVLLFGVAHQGGVLPVLLGIGKSTAANCQRRTDVIFYHTYMPPVHLLGHVDGGTNGCQVVLHDLKGADLFQLQREIGSVGEALLVTPLTEKELNLSAMYNLTLVQRVFPHVTFDDFPPLANLVVRVANGRISYVATLANIRKRFSLNVYSVVDRLYEYRKYPHDWQLSVIVDTGALQA